MYLMHQNIIGMQAQEHVWEYDVVVHLLQISSRDFAQCRRTATASHGHALIVSRQPHRPAKKRPRFQIVAAVAIRCESIQMRMQGGAMVAFRVILENEFPVGSDIVGSPMSHLQLRKMPLLVFIDYRCKRVFERFRAFCQIHEHATFPCGNGHVPQRILFFVKRFDFMHVWGSDQTTIEGVSPGMIRALNGL